MKRLTNKHYKPGDGHYMMCSEKCQHDLRECCDCEEFDRIVDRLGEIEDILGDDYDLESLRKAVNQTRQFDQLCREMSDIRLAMGYKTYEGLKDAILSGGLLRLRKLVEADREGRCVVLLVAPALQPLRQNEVIMVCDDGRVVSDHVTEVLIGEESGGKLGCVYQTIDGECFNAADIGVRVFRAEIDTREWTTSHNPFPGIGGKY